MNDDLVAFLKARLASDEASARDAFGDHNDDGPEWTEISSGALSTGHELHGIGDSAITRHMERWDPARVLAEVDAKRRIIARHRPIAATDDLAKPEWIGACDGCGLASDGPWTPTMNDCPELRDLASVYREHADYRPEWAPEA